MKCIKYLIFIFNFLFLVSGIAIIAVGSVALVTISKYDEAVGVGVTAGAALLVSVGVIVTIIAFLGCCGAVKESYCMVMTFAVLLGVIFVLELAAGITCYVYRNRVDSLAYKGFMDFWNQYGASDDVTKSIDVIQHDVKCCGVNNSSDWSTLPWGISHPGQYPSSCCKDSPAVCKPGGAVYTVGCYETVKDDLERSILIVAGVGIGVAFIQLIGIFFACCLGRSIRKEYEVV